MQDYLTIINYPNIRNICIQGGSEERYLWCSECVCVYISAAFSMALAVARVGCQVVLSVMEGNVQQYKVNI